MKTLNVKSTGVVEFNYDGLYIHTDTSDQDVPTWAMDDLTAIINEMQAESVTEVHMEDTGAVQFHHRIKNAEVTNGPTEFPTVFVDMATFASEYVAAQQAAEQAKAAALAAANDLTATQAVPESDYVQP